LKVPGSITASEGAFSIPAYTYHDIQGKVAFGGHKQFEFYVGCNNLFDKQPPFIASGDSQWPGTNTVADTYDLFRPDALRRCDGKVLIAVKIGR